jgi:hypothetical protein
MHRQVLRYTGEHWQCRAPTEKVTTQVRIETDQNSWVRFSGQKMATGIFEEGFV